MSRFATRIRMLLWGSNPVAVILTFVFKILKFAESRQLTKSCWIKKIMKQKTLYGIRYVNKKIIKNKMIQSCEQDFLLFVINCQKKKKNNPKIVAFFSKSHETRQAFGTRNTMYCEHTLLLEFEEFKFSNTSGYLQ